VPSVVGQIAPKLGIVALPQNFRAQVTCGCEPTNVVATAVDVPLQLGQRQIVSL
jgi:hypothetical protein